MICRSNLLAWVAVASVVFAGNTAATIGNDLFDDAIVVWQMDGLDDKAGKNSRLVAEGDVQLGIDLANEELEESRRRGGDGQVARFNAGWLSAGQGADSELNLPGNRLSICLRICNPEGNWGSPIFSKHGGGDKLIYNVFAGAMGPRQYVRSELGTTGNGALLSMRAALDPVGLDEWHDVVIVCDGAKVQFYLDGVWQDEDFLVGDFRQNNPAACLIGAEQQGEKINGGLIGLVDHVALWNRPLAEAEIVSLCGGPETVAARRKQLLPPADAPMQYSKTPYEDWNVGDCLPFFHDGTYHFYYLTDKRHHGSKNGLGAHQWAHSSSRDLVHWEHHPLAVPITEQWEGSICTGSVYWHDGTYYAFYASRKADRTGEYLSLATSKDGIHFEKQKPNPLAGPQPPYVVGPFRDPHVLRDPATGLFHMLVTARLAEYPLAGREDCLAQLVSKDLRTWEQRPPFYVTGYRGAPECPEYFEWNGWHYLISSVQATARYRMSRQPLGPWLRPPVDTLGGPREAVMKSAAFTGNRRISAAWLGHNGWAGNAVFRELVQHKDGTLGTKFPPEMIPKSGEPIALKFGALTAGVTHSDNRMELSALDGFSVGVLEDVPQDTRIRMRIVPKAGSSYFGITLRGAGKYETGNELRFCLPERKVVLQQPNAPPRYGDEWQSLTQIDGLDQPITLDVISKGELIDISINNQHTMINRVGLLPGTRLYFFAFQGAATFEEIDVRPLK